MLTLEELRLQIVKYGPLVGTDKDRFAHNIVSMCLSRIAKDFGVAAANEAIKDMGLEPRGFKPRNVTEGD